MEIPITIATVIALTHSDGKTYIDATETFVFFGTPMGSDVSSVYECAIDMAEARTDDIDAGDMWAIFDTDSIYNLKELDFTEGQVSVRWEQRL